MSYTPTTWQTGDTITAAGLNKIEQGIANAGSALICNSSYSSDANNYVLDKTVQEIYDALLAGTPVYIKYQYGDFTTYTGTLYLAPVIKVYNYAYTNTIRVVASKPVRNPNDNFSPAIIEYVAGGLNDYPEYGISKYVNNTSLTDGDIN